MEIRTATIFLTKNCNLDCPHCYLEHNNHYLSFNKFKYIMHNYKIKSLTLTGGEPLLHPEITLIIDYVLHKKIKTRLLTNGILINTEMLNTFKKNRELMELNITFNADRLFLLEKIKSILAHGLTLNINHILYDNEINTLELLPKEINSICLIYPTPILKAQVPIFNSDKWNKIINFTYTKYKHIRTKFIHEPVFLKKKDARLSQSFCPVQDSLTFNTLGMQCRCCLLLNEEPARLDQKACRIIQKISDLAAEDSQAICPILLSDHTGRIW